MRNHEPKEIVRRYYEEIGNQRQLGVVVEGRFVERKILADTCGMLEQLGAIPTPTSD